MPRAKSKTLSQWILDKGDAKVAEMAGVSEAAARSWRLGYRVPRPDMAARLIKLSRGALSWDTLYEREPAKMPIGRPPGAKNRKAA